jgi:hypothetical protein
VHDAEADPDREREQALLRGAGKIAEGELDGFGQVSFIASFDVATCGADTVFMAVPPVLFGLGLRPERSRWERTRREDRRSKFNGERDYLQLGA